MLEIARFRDGSDRFELGFVERESTPKPTMKFGIRPLLLGLLLSNTILQLEKFGVEQSRKTVHDWVQKADLQPADDASPDHVALNETVIRINGQQFWLYATVAPDTNGFPYLRLFTPTTTALTQTFPQEFQEKYDVSNAVFLVDYPQYLAAALRRAGPRFQTVCHGNWNAVERVFHNIKRRISSFTNSFSHVQPTTAETWLQVFAIWWNSLN